MKVFAARMGCSLLLVMAAAVAVADSGGGIGYEGLIPAEPGQPGSRSSDSKTSDVYSYLLNPGSDSRPPEVLHQQEREKKRAEDAKARQAQKALEVAKRRQSGAGKLEKEGDTVPDGESEGNSQQQQEHQTELIDVTRQQKDLEERARRELEEAADQREP
ncbi:MAG: hypothetical protein HY052_04120 [Proteobacteria bacterium]|nr:hypothetical protein [Pseudomonadota bacterium]